MGLTGVILTATVQLLPVETSLMSVDTERATDLDDLMARLTATDHRYRYSVAWIDLLARGAATGRAVLTRGDHAPLDALPARARARRHRWPSAPAGSRPPPPSCPRACSAGRPSASSTSSGTARPRARVPANSRGSPRFFHPLDGVPHWNRIYGRGGFVQYQFVVGHGQEDAAAPDRAP